MPKSHGNVLIVDDDEYILLTAKMFLEQYFTLVHSLNSPDKIKTQLNSFDYDVVLLDMNFREGDTSGREGIEWLKYINDNHPDKSVILVTAYGGISIAVQSMKEGAFDFIVKPWQNEKLLTTVTAALNLRKEKKKVFLLENQREIMNADLSRQFDLIGESGAMQDVYGKIEKVAPTLAEVLILGENGTGKELVARALHKKSIRASEVFISVDVGSISESLFESELFGHKKGSFTDAHNDRIGRIEAANAGTLFLDEVGNLSPKMQAKLLTVIQNKKVIPVGANQPVDVDVRIISATNKDLSKMVKEGTFREDLLYRINTVEIHVPPLKARDGDITLLANYFLKFFSKKYQKDHLRIAAESYKKMEVYGWPGNVRELRHTIERTVIMCENDTILPDDLGLGSSSTSLEPHFDDYNLELLEKWAIEKVLVKHNGNISHAASELGLSRGAMYRRLDKYDI